MKKTMRLAAVASMLFLAACTAGCGAIQQIRESLSGRVTQASINSGCRAAQWNDGVVTNPVVPDYYADKRVYDTGCRPVVVGGEDIPL